jgi:outer membrane protein OmpA-like peptidoglycan-associated protein
MKILYTSLLVFLYLCVWSQNDCNEPPEPIFAIGVTGGGNMSSFTYSAQQYSKYKQDLFLNPQFGVAGEIYFGKMISLRPALYYSGRGTEINTEGVRYLLASRNIDFALPLMLTFATDKSVSPFFYMAPVYEIVTGGTVGTADVSTDLNTSSFAKTGFALCPGAGVKFRLSSKMYFSVEADYFYGLSDTYSDSELNGTANALNVNDYTIEGTRKNRAPELRASLMFVINKKKDQIVIIGDDTEDKPVRDTIRVVERDESERDTVTVNEVKESYTVKEIESDIREGIDVTNRKITFHNIEFEFNKTALTNDSKLYLNEVIRFLKENKTIKVQINGHTDNIGSKLHNMALSEGRAKGVYDYLISTGINSERLTYKGYGDTKPIDDNATESGRAKNRRVEFQIIHQ